MWNYSAHDFVSERAFLDAVGEVPLGVDIDIVGLNADGTAYFVNVAWGTETPIASFVATQIDPASAPRWWAGVPLAEPETPSPPVPQVVTRRQILVSLMASGMITPEEALAAAQTGAVPALIAGAFSNLDPVNAVAAQITWATMSVVERNHPLVNLLVSSGIATDEQVDAIFHYAATVT